MNKERTKGRRARTEKFRLVKWQKDQEAKYQDLAYTLQGGAGPQVTIRPESHQLTITVFDQILVDSGSPMLKSSGLHVLSDIGPILHQVEDQEIRIEEHTDSLPLRFSLQQRYRSNWELSTARATEVILYLIDHHEIDPRNLMSTGFGDTRPRASHVTPDGRQQNRRIEIVLSPNIQHPLLVQQVSAVE